MANCNFNDLKRVAARSKRCPIMGCDATYTRLHDVVRDLKLKEKLTDVERSVDVVWLRGDEISIERPRGGLREVIALE